VRPLTFAFGARIVVGVQVDTERTAAREEFPSDFEGGGDDFTLPRVLLNRADRHTLVVLLSGGSPGAGGRGRGFTAEGLIRGGTVGWKIRPVSAAIAGSSAMRTPNAPGVSWRRASCSSE
jgi:hypothetical protein